MPDAVPATASDNVKTVFRDHFEYYLSSDEEDAGRWRSTAALSMFNISQGMDDWNGAGPERARILEVMKENSITPMVLGGDLHTSWAFTLYEGGGPSGTGDPVAINLGM